MSDLVENTEDLFSHNEAARLPGQLRGDSAFVFATSVESTIPLPPKSVTIFCGCTARFVSDLVGNPEDRFPHYAAHKMFDQIRHKGFSIIFE